MLDLTFNERRIKLIDKINIADPIGTSTCIRTRRIPSTQIGKYETETSFNQEFTSCACCGTCSGFKRWFLDYVCAFREVVLSDYVVGEYVCESEEVGGTYFETAGGDEGEEFGF